MEKEMVGEVLTKAEMIQGGGKEYPASLIKTFTIKISNMQNELKTLTGGAMPPQLVYTGTATEQQKIALREALEKCGASPMLLKTGDEIKFLPIGQHVHNPLQPQAEPAKRSSDVENLTPSTECPRCDAVWSKEEIDFQACDNCGYPLQADNDFTDKVFDFSAIEYLH